MKLLDRPRLARCGRKRERRRGEQLRLRVNARLLEQRPAPRGRVSPRRREPRPRWRRSAGRAARRHARGPRCRGRSPGRSRPKATAARRARRSPPPRRSAHTSRRSPQRGARRPGQRRLPTDTPWSCEPSDRANVTACSDRSSSGSTKTRTLTRHPASASPRRRAVQPPALAEDLRLLALPSGTTRRSFSSFDAGRVDRPRVERLSTSRAASPAPTGSAAGSGPPSPSRRRAARRRRRRVRPATSCSQRARPSATVSPFRPVTTGSPSAYATRMPTW